MDKIPERALSVRQPWAWAIIHAGKDIENRSWQAVNHGLRQRGRICIHASKGITRHEYESTAAFIEKVTGSPAPPPADLERGGIIGTVEVVDVVSESDSPWFFGPRGLVLADPQPVPFIPAAGQLGYFKWVSNASIVCKQAKWMIDAVRRHPADSPPGADLFGEIANG